MICQKCNNKVSSDDKFCNNCGQKLLKEDKNIVGYMCPLCKTPNPEAVKYCVKCGHWMLDTITPAKPITKEEYKNYFEESKLDGKRGKYKALIFWFLITLLFLVASVDAKMLLSFLVIFVGIISIIKPIKFLGIKSRGKGGIVSVIGIIILFVSASLLTPDVPTSVDTTTSIDEYKAQSITIPYDDLIRETDKYIGTIVNFSGRVVEVQEVGPNIFLRVNITKSEYGFYDDTIWVNYSLKEDEKRIIDDDIVNLWGEVKGRKTYTAILGNRITIPEINARKIEIIKN